MNDEAIKGDFICITNVAIEKILEWLEKHKWQSSISYKDREFKGKVMYPEVYIFENRNVLDRFIEALNLAEDSLEGFMAHDIKYYLSSSIDNIRIIKKGKLEDKMEDSKGMCGFVDAKSFEKEKEIVRVGDRFMIKIYDIDYHYGEIFYWT